CASPRRELVGEPDAGNLHLRFEEGKVSRATASLALLPTLPALTFHAIAAHSAVVPVQLATGDRRLATF
ncbi:MAG: hypothetical protein ACR2L2_08010, partial [Acidobacteriota bacterium]